MGKKQRLYIYILTLALSIASIGSTLICANYSDNITDNFNIIMLVVLMNLMSMNLFIRLLNNQDLRYLFFSALAMFMIFTNYAILKYIIIFYLPIDLAFAIISTVKMKKQDRQAKGENNEQ